MSYSKNFNKALSEGKTMVRSIRKNINSDKDQYTVQFMQQVDNPNSEGTDEIVALSQGYTPGQRVTALASVAGKKLEEMGIMSLLAKTSDKLTTFFEEEDTLLEGTRILGVDLDISVEENTTKNPLSMSQQPKINPTSNEVLTSDGLPIYRHTKVVKRGKGTYNFLAHDVDGVVNTSEVSSIEENEMANS
jgi:hypothetical protein